VLVEVMVEKEKEKEASCMGLEWAITNSVPVHAG
jgi:hypothetical protein